MSNRVELRPAFTWICEECGEDNFVVGRVPELSEEEIEELRQEHGVQPWEIGHFMAMPQKVVCEYCHLVFKTEHYDNDQ